MYTGLDANHDLITAWLEVSHKKTAVARELAERARRCTALSDRQRQILPEIVDHSLSALDLLTCGWNKRQALWVGCGARSLYEAQIVASYIVKSTENTERFYQDGLIDIRDIFDSLQVQSSVLGEVADFKKLIDVLRTELSQVLTANQIPANARHLGTAEIAKNIGGQLEHKLVYQFLSKFSHSSSVAVLTRKGETWLAMILPLLAMIGLNGYMLMLAAIADATPNDA